MQWWSKLQNNSRFSIRKRSPQCSRVEQKIEKVTGDRGFWLFASYYVLRRRLAFKNGFPIHTLTTTLAYIANIGSRRNMLLVVTLAKTRCKFYTRKLSPKIEDKKLHFDKEKTLVPYQFPPFFRGPLEEKPFYLFLKNGTVIISPFICTKDLVWWTHHGLLLRL